MGRIHTIVTFALLSCCLAVPAEARSGRQNSVPHGSDLGCDVCHTGAGNGLNDFGFDSFQYTSGSTVNWAELSQLDSDRDGYSNGEELGDPTGSWRPGQADPGGSYTHPGDRTDGLCGNGTYEGAEECEGSDLGGATCSSLGLGSGNLRCDSTCKYDQASCSTCGDGTLQSGEDCEGTNLGGATCESLGLGGGSLACNGCRFDTSGCDQGGAAEGPATCGDGFQQTGEQCDGIDFGSQTCATLGYVGGTLGCTASCVFETSNCIGAGSGTSTPTTTPGPTSDPTPAENAYADNIPQGETEADGLKISAEGRACTTAMSRPAATGWVLLIGLLLGLPIRRRR